MTFRLYRKRLTMLPKRCVKSAVQSAVVAAVSAARICPSGSDFACRAVPPWRRRVTRHRSLVFNAFPEEISLQDKRGLLKMRVLAVPQSTETRTPKPMEPYQLLQITIALSAYLAAIRIATLNRIADKETTEDRKKKLVAFLFWLVPADLCFVVGALFLLAHIYKPHLFGSFGFLLWATRLFCAGVIVLSIHHGIAWVKSAKKYWCG